MLWGLMPGPLATGLTGQEESPAKRKFPLSERLLMIVAAIHGALLDDGRSAMGQLTSGVAVSGFLLQPLRHGLLLQLVELLYAHQVVDLAKRCEQIRPVDHMIFFEKLGFEYLHRIEHAGFDRWNSVHCGILRNYGLTRNMP